MLEARQLHHDALAGLAGENVIVHVGRRLDDAVDGRAERNRLRLVGVVVGLPLGDFRLVADDERPRVADAAVADDAHILDAERGVGRQRHLEALHLELGGLVAALLFLGRRVHRFAAEHFHAGAAEVEVQPLDAGQVPAGDLQLEGAARLAAHRKDIVDARRRTMLCRRVAGAGEHHEYRKQKSAADDGWLASHRGTPPSLESGNCGHSSSVPTDRRWGQGKT